MHRLLLTDLLLQRSITTTASRAKLVIPFANRLLGLAQSYQQAQPNRQLTIRRRVLSQVMHPLAAKELLERIGPTLTKPTVISTRQPARHGDHAAMIELSISVKTAEPTVAQATKEPSTKAK